MSVPIENQINELRRLYTQHMNDMYEQNFRRKFAAVYSLDKNWYSNKIEFIDICAAVLEHSIMANNPRRILRYYILLVYNTEELKKRCEEDFINKFQ